ncbi:MAG TPA: VOC family protein [Candidatus Bathyarchaeia archaeon]|nr:VOC family protein [Candidatus Bathyarchaeia archaeon]
MPLRVDHFSIAVHSIDRALEFFTRYFPVRMRVATRPGYTDEFRWCDFYVGHVKLELIESARPGSFVERFLARRGEGIHHLSLEVTELDPLIERMKREGLRIADEFDAGDGDKTAFISPRSAHGMLVQFWQVKELDVPPPSETPRIAPLPGTDTRMRFDHLSVAVESIPETMEFFRRYFPVGLESPPHRGYAGDFDLQQFDLADFRMEVIADASGSSFVKSFLARRGEGFHHISIDVDDLEPVVARMRADGVRIVDEADLGGGYKTAFVSPRSAHGVLIQFWQIPSLENGNW